LTAEEEEGDLGGKAKASFFWFFIQENVTAAKLVLNENPENKPLNSFYPAWGIIVAQKHFFLSRCFWLVDNGLSSFY